MSAQWALMSLHVVKLPTHFSKPAVGAWLRRSTASCALISSPRFFWRSMRCALPTSAHVLILRTGATGTPGVLAHIIRCGMRGTRPRKSVRAPFFRASRFSAAASDLLSFSDPALITAGMRVPTESGWRGFPPGRKVCATSARACRRRPLPLSEFSTTMLVMSAVEIGPMSGTSYVTGQPHSVAVLCATRAAVMTWPIDPCTRFSSLRAILRSRARPWAFPLYLLTSLRRNSSSCCMVQACKPLISMSSTSSGGSIVGTKATSPRAFFFFFPSSSPAPPSPLSPPLSSPSSPSRGGGGGGGGDRAGEARIRDSL
mmetsp:Transcript_14349/g.45620  ORF Transcript_14349/g.45620 Transcript_14349/m.45620 type:complete len:314 (+) Transcript_14349:599-1540(+)